MGPEIEIPKSQSNQQSQINSEVVCPKVRYFDSFNDLETTSCFLLFQDTRGEPRELKKFEKKFSRRQT